MTAHDSELTSAAARELVKRFIAQVRDWQDLRIQTGKSWTPLTPVSVYEHDGLPAFAVMVDEIERLERELAAANDELQMWRQNYSRAASDE